MDAIRAALGEPRISYLGGSSAALLGTVYTTLFPRRVDRFVLDSPPNPDTVWRPYELDRVAAMEENWAAFRSWLAGNDATYRMGGTPEAVRAWFQALFDRAAAAPLPAGDHAWSYPELGTLLITATYFEQYWPAVAADAAAIVAGEQPPVPIAIRPAAAPELTGVPADNHTAVNLAYRCADGAWPRDPGVYRADLARLVPRYPVYGPAVANLNPCAFWPAHPAARVPLAANRASRVLVVAALHDASVPPDNSRAVAAAIRDSRLVTVDLRTHVPYLGGAGNACLAGAVTGYLRDGTLPGTDLAC